MSESTIKILIYIHAVTGGISLISGLIPLLTKKGAKPHRIAGKIFVYSLFIATVIALYVSTQKNHENPFLFLIGILSLYFIISGVRSLKYKFGNVNLTFSIITSFTLLLSSIGMILYPIIFYGKVHLLFTVFGALGLNFSIRDLLLYRNKEKLKRSWLKLHVESILAAYISCLTAFIVVNQIIPSFAGWIAPGVIGGFYIAYWSRKVDNGTWAK